MKRVLVIGTGSIAKRHIRNLKAEFPTAIIAVMSASKRNISAQALHADEVVRTLADALRGGLDAAIVASPAPWHLQQAAVLLEHGVATLIEKPLCADLAEVQQWPELSDSPRALVGYNLRLLPAAKLVKATIESGQLGSVVSISAEVGNYLPNWRPDHDYRTGVTAQRRLGGGVLLELSHELDYLNWIFGAFQTLVSAVSNSRRLDVDVEDTVDVMMTTRAGALCHLHLNMLQAVPSRTLQVKGTQGNLSWNIQEHKVELRQGQQPSQLLYHEPGYDLNETYKKQLHALFALPQRVDDTATVASSIEVMRLIEAVRRAGGGDAWAKVNHE